MSNESKYDSAFKRLEQKYKNEIGSIGKIIGKGSFGEVRDIKYKNKMMAIKILEKDKKDKLQGEKLATNLRNHNIIKIEKIYENEKFKNISITNDNEYSSNSRRDMESSKSDEKNYGFIIMEKAQLKDLEKWNKLYYKYNLLKLIKLKNDDNYLFDEYIGDNLIRFYARQIINALGALYQNDYIHFDIKPENLLVTFNLIIKLTDFSLLKEIKKSDQNFKLPGGTREYITPQYYIEEKMKVDSARKQDFFAFGSSLFLLKYGLPLLKYKEYKDNQLNAERIIDLLQFNINYIKSQVFTDKEFMAFIISLIGYRPEDRADYQKIFRNKWLNKNNEVLDKILMAFDNDEEKLIIELQKMDFLMRKEKCISQNENNTFGKTKKFRFKKN